MKLFYRHGSTGKFESTDAEVEGDQVRATIPPEAVVPTIVEYYLQGFDKGGLPVVSRGDAEAPLRIAGARGAKAWVLPVAIGGGVLVAPRQSSAASSSSARARPAEDRTRPAEHDHRHRQHRRLSEPQDRERIGPSPAPSPGFHQVLVDVDEAEADAASGILFDIGATGIEERDATTLAKGAKRAR